MPVESASAFVRRLVRAREDGDTTALWASFEWDVRAFIANANGGTDLVEGSEALEQRFPDFAVKGARSTRR